MTATATSPPRWRRRRHEVPQRPVDPGQLPEAGVIDAARRGDLRAWEHLTRRHQEVVFRSAYLTTRDSDLAVDVTKAAFLRAYRSLGSLEDGAAIRPWLMGIAATEARTHIRKIAQRRDAKVSDPDPCPRIPATPIIIDPAIPRPTRPEHEALVDAFEALVDEDRLIIASRYSFDLSRADAAIRLGIAPNDIDGRLRTAMRRSRAHLAEAMAVTTTSGSGARSPAGPSPAGRLATLPDDRLGSVTMAAVFSELPWTPDVAPDVCTRLAREAVAYPEQSSSRATRTGEHAGQAASTEQPAASAARTGQGRQGPPARGIGALPMTAVALFVVFALVGFSVLYGAGGRDVPADVGARVSELFGQDASDPAAGEGGGAALTGQPSAAEDPRVTKRVPDAPVVERDTVQAPELSIVGARTLGNGGVGAEVSVDWSPVAGFGPVVRTQLERKVGDGGWQSVAAAAAQAPMQTAVRPGRRYRFRVRSFDDVGAAAVSPAVRVELAVRDPRSSRLALAPDGWITRRGNIIKRRLIATTPDASLSTDFSGSGVALVGPTGPTRGAIGVRIDGGAWTQDDLRTWESSPRTVVFSQDLEQGAHSLDLRAEADGVAVDAVLIVRTTQA